VPLERSGWNIGRESRSELASAGRVIETLVDAPFYVRSLLSTQLGGTQVTSIHESLDLQRFQRRWVQALLPFRMPRWPWRQ
jgi:carotenoid 1,2-hydratase